MLKKMKYYLILCWLTMAAIPTFSQGLSTDGPLTIRPMLQQLGERLLQGKQGSIVAIRPETGEIIEPLK